MVACYSSPNGVRHEGCVCLGFPPPSPATLPSLRLAHHLVVFMTQNVVMALWVCTHLPTHQLVYFKHVQPSFGSHTLITWFLMKKHKRRALCCVGLVSGSRILLMKETYFFQRFRVLAHFSKCFNFIPYKIKICLTLGTTGLPWEWMGTIVSESAQQTAFTGFIGL